MVSKILKPTRIYIFVKAQHVFGLLENHLLAASAEDMVRATVQLDKLPYHCSHEPFRLPSTIIMCSR